MTKDRPEETIMLGVAVAALILSASCTSGQPTSMQGQTIPDMIDVIGNDGSSSPDHRVIRDRQTGCHYIANWRGGYIERKDREGRQICTTTVEQAAPEPAHVEPRSAAPNP